MLKEMGIKSNLVEIRDSVVFKVTFCCSSFNSALNAVLSKCNFSKRFPFPSVGFNATWLHQQNSEITDTVSIMVGLITIQDFLWTFHYFSP